MRKTLLGVFYCTGFMAFGQINTPQAPVNQVQSSISPVQLESNRPIFNNHPVTASPANFSATLSPALQHDQHSTCKAHELNEAHFASMGILNEYNQSYYNGVHNVNPANLDKTPNANEISIIFHVVYNPNNPAENVSNANIMNVYNNLVEDYLLLNSDAGNVRSGFGFTPANPGINFCLATQDPMGTPLSEVGVVRVSTTEDWYDSNSGEENKMKSSATGGSDSWDRNKYLNVWICDISNGLGYGTAGYAYRPTTTYLPSAAIDGIVIDYNLGVNNPSYNVLTHETGHYLGLDHTWGGSGSCSSDDGFNDTPNTIGPADNQSGFYCGIANFQTCGPEVQYENYMDYATGCTCMFTQDQADYMLTILQGIRSSLLISTGCDPTNTPPNSAFASIPAGPAPVVISQNASVSFYDQSTNVPTGWNWVISGTQGTDWAYTNGTSATSQDPQVTFYNAGTYDVTLTASNAYGVDATPASEPGYVQVVAPATGTGCDTLRNWDPADAAANGYYYYTVPATNGAWGKTPGHCQVDLYGDGSSVEYCYQVVEKYNYTGTAQVRRISAPFFKASDISGTGTIEMRVYANDNGAAPGTVLASEVINISDINASNWNEFDFTTPATITGQFWVGFYMNYGSPQDTILIGMTDTQTGGIDGYYMDMQTYGWLNSTAMGITGSIAIDVMLSNGPDPIADFTATNDKVCPGGQIDVNGASSQNTTNYYWQLAASPFTTAIPPSSSNSSNSYTFNTPGSYRIYLSADGSCRTHTVYLPVTVNPTVAATVTPAATTCGNNNGTITVTGATGGNGTYYYSLDGITYYSSNTFNNLPSGTYTVYVTTPGDNCETVYSNIVVGASTALTASASANTAVCPGGSTTISASGGTSYAWYDGSTLIASTASTSVTPGSQTQYSCVVTDGSGCQSTVYTTVSVNTPPTAPTITPSGATTFCSGGDVDLTSSYGSGNVWSNAQTGSTITVNSSGAYSVTYTDGNGCSSTSTPVTVTVVTPPTISAGTVSDPSACATATGSIQVSGSGTGDVSWSGSATGSATGVTLPYTIPSLAAGSYNITYTDGTGCTSNTLNQSLTDPTPPTSPVITPSGATTFCNGGSVTLSSSYAAGNNWSNSATTQDIVVTTSGTYSVTYTDGSGCSASSSPVVVTVNNNPSAPTISAGGATTFCDGGSVTLTSSQGTGNSWSTSATTQAINVTTSGSYTVTYTNANGCSTTSTPTVVTVNPIPTAPTISAGGATTFCAGGSVTLTSSQASGNNWSTTETTQAISVTSSGSYTVAYTDGNGCQATSTPTVVTVNALPTVNAGSDQTVCEGTQVTLSGSGASTYTWDNSVTDGVGFTPSSGTTTYTVTGTDANGCSNTDQVDVIVNALPAVTFSSLSNTCENYAAFTLSGGSPSGGTYSGTGVSGGQFDPSVGTGTYTITYSYTDANSCSNTATSDITVDACLAVETIEGSDLEVYPNPFGSILNVKFNGEYNYALFDASGRVITNGKAMNQSIIDVDHLEAGYYTLRVTSGENTYSVRLTKAN